MNRPTKKGKGSWVDIGLRQYVQVDCLVLPETRMTVRVKNYGERNAVQFEGEAVSKKVPKD